jgi:Ni/Co efflux regulator RcnB
MMLKALSLTALVLGLTGGVAMADRDHGRRDHDRHGGAVVRDHRGDHRTWNRGNNVVIRDRGHWDRGSRVVIRERPRYYNNYNYDRRVVRRPIYISRPFIGHRYFNYYQRPALIVENYNTMPGYYWVRGQWTWDGREWQWMPGHYEPDPSYADPSYGYYDSY